MSPFWTLPGESIPKRDARSLRRLLLTTVTIVALANVAALVGMSFVQTNFGYEIVKLKFTLADTIEEPVDWVFVGDSTCNQGISPHRFEELTGQTAINLCMIGNMTVAGDVWVLDRLIQNVGAPRRGVLLSHAYDVWMRDGEGLEVIMAETDSTLEWRRNRALVPATWAELAQVGVGRHLPLLTRPESVHRLLYSALRAPPHHTFDDLGFMEAGPAEPDRVLRDVRGHLRQQTESYSLSELNRRALLEVDELVDVPVLIVSTPMVAELWEHEEIQDRVTQAYADVRELSGSRPGLRLLRQEPWTYRPEQMHNADHIDAETALIHTEAVVAALREAGALQP